MTKLPRRPRDPAQLAKLIVDIATGEGPRTYARGKGQRPFCGGLGQKGRSGPSTKSERGKAKGDSEEGGVYSVEEVGLISAALTVTSVGVSGGAS